MQAVLDWVSDVDGLGKVARSDNETDAEFAAACEAYRKLAVM